MHESIGIHAANELLFISTWNCWIWQNIAKNNFINPQKL